MSFEDFSNVMLLLIFSSFFVERCLSVVFESNIYITKHGSKENLKPTVAVGVSVVYLIVTDINIAVILSGKGNIGFEWSNPYDYAKNIVIILITSMFVAGGSKASLKFFRDVMKIQSTGEAVRRSTIKPAPAKPKEAAVAAANGNTNAKELIFNMLDSGVPTIKL